jgi:3-hydroxyisobutyrate dehydrogenase
VLKDIGLFQKIADHAGVPLEISPLMIEIFRDGQRRYGARANSDDIVRRLEQAAGLSILAPGFPPEMIDDEAEAPGYEVTPPGRS